MLRLKEIETDYNLDIQLIPFVQDVPFFAEISRQVRKVLTDDPQMPTAGVTWDQETDNITMYLNPKFMQKLGVWATRGLFTHEFYHLIFGHLGVRRREPNYLWNIATDLAINSIIMESAGSGENRPRNFSVSRDDGPLPNCGCIPGQIPNHPDGRKLTKEEVQVGSLADIISKLPKMLTSEDYYHRLLKEAEKNKQEGGGGGQGSDGDEEGDNGWGNMDSMDSHEGWDATPDGRREYIESKVKAIVERAVRHADSKSNGWGNIPANMRTAIRQSISNIVDWRAVLQQFIGSLVRGGRRNSLKRINRRYPYIHPGSTRSYKAKLLVAIDQSGSVDSEMLELFFAELTSATRKIEVDILPFDCYADVKDVWTWHKGENIPPTREKCGGTCFNAPTEVFNDPKNIGRWDGMLIMTDGQAPKPVVSRQKRGWILGKGCSTKFETDELTINLDEDKPMTGAWR